MAVNPRCATTHATLLLLHHSVDGFPHNVDSSITPNVDSSILQCKYPYCTKVRHNKHGGRLPLLEKTQRRSVLLQNFTHAEF